LNGLFNERNYRPDESPEFQDISPNYHLKAFFNFISNKITIWFDCGEFALLCVPMAKNLRKKIQ